MKKFLLLCSFVTLFLGVNAQNTALPTLEQLKALALNKQELMIRNSREIVSCTRETYFNWDETGMVWDSSEQFILEVDVTSGYTTVIASGYEFTDPTGWSLTQKTYGYGIEGSVEVLTKYDSIVVFAEDQVSGMLVEYFKVIPTYNAAGNIEFTETYLNLGFFGIPGGTVLFGKELFYYDANDYQIANATKEYDLGTFTLINGDSTHFVNNSAGQPLTETSWSWDSTLEVYIPQSRYTYTYDVPGGELTTRINENWDEIMQDWAYNSRTLFTYIKPGLLSKEEIQIGSPGNWETIQEISYTYDGQDRLTLELQQNVDVNGIKTPISRVNNSYETIQGWNYESISQYYSGGTWVNDSRTISEDCANTGTAPDAPTGLIATAGGATTINLSWADNSSNEVNFRIERSSNGINFSEITQVNANSTNFSDSGLSSGTLYYYRVRAANVSGFSAFTNVASAETMTSSLSDPASAGFMKAYFSSASTLQLEFIAGSQPQTLRLFDVQGKMVHQTALHAGINQIDIPNLHTGVYMARVTFTDGKMATLPVHKG